MTEPAIGLRDQFIFFGKQLHDFGHGQKIFIGQHIGRSQWHQFDEAQRQTMFGGEQDERPEFRLVHAAHQHAI